MAGIRKFLGTLFGAAAGAPVAKTITLSAQTAGVVYTPSRFLSTTSVFSLVTGSNSNLTINATTGVVSATTAIPFGTFQLALVREAIASQNLAIEYPVTLTASNITNIGGGSSASINSPTIVAQFAGSQRYFRATADRAGTWSLGSGGNASDFTIDAVTGIYSVNTNAVGDGTVQLTKMIPIVFTPTDGSLPVGKTVTVTLGTIAAPSALSQHFNADLTGAAQTPPVVYPAGKKLETLPGFAITGGAASLSDIVTDGNGGLHSDASTTSSVGVMMSPPTLNNLVARITITTLSGSYNRTNFAFASDGFANGVSVSLIFHGQGFEIGAGELYIRQTSQDTSLGYPDTQVLSDNTYTADLVATFSADGNTLTLAMIGTTTATFTIDLTGKTKGTKFGFINNGQGGYCMPTDKVIKAIGWSIPNSGLAVVSAPNNVPGNVATWSLTWDTTKNKPSAIQHSFDGTIWFTGDSIINSDGTISYTGTAPGMGTLLPSFRALNDTGVVAKAATATRFLAPVTKFGANLVDSSGWYSPTTQFQMFDDLFVQGYWQDAANSYSYNVDGKVDANGMPLANGLQRQIARGPISGETLEMTWTGSPNMGISLAPVGGNITYGAITRPTAQSARWTETFTYDGANATFGGVIFTGIDTANPPKNIKIRVVGQAVPQYPPFTDAYVSLMSTFNGPLRLMDVLNTNLRTDGLATFASDQKILENAIILGNATNRDVWWNIPIFATDVYIKAIAQAFFTGAGTSNGVALKTNVWFEYSNEVWNTGFAAYHLLANNYATRTGQTRLADNAGGAQQSFAEHAFQHNHAMTVIESTVPTYMNRVVRVIGTQSDGGGHYSNVKTAGIGHYDANANAPYFQVASNPDQSPAALGITWKQAFLNSFSVITPTRDQTYLDGKRFVCYEGGPDYLNTDLSLSAITAFKNSPQFYDVMKAYFDAWSSGFGDVFNIYTDIGLATWGIMPYQGDPTPEGYNALVDAIAGNLAHKPTTPTPLLSTFVTPGANGYTVSNNGHTVTGAAGASTALIRTTISHQNNGSGLFWLEGSHDTLGEPRFGIGLANTTQSDAAEGGDNSLIMYFNEDGTGYIVTPLISGPPDFTINSGLTLAATHHAMLVDLVNSAVTFYSGTKKTPAFDLPPNLKNGAVLSGFMQLGTGDVGSWTTASAKEVNSIEWG